MHHLGAFTVILSALLGSASAQQVWNVNCQGGPAAHFTDLPPAVAAAAPGDEIRVYVDATMPSCVSQPYYTAPIIDKPLRIVGFTMGLGTYANVQGAILIVGLQSNEQVILSNLSILQSSPPVSQSGIVALNCQGSILIEDCGYSSIGTPGSYMRFENCAQVAVRGCELRLGGDPVEAINTTLLISNTYVYHRPPFYGPPYSYSQTAPGLRVTNSTVTLIESIIDGSDGYTVSPQASFIARSGMVVNSGTVRIGPGSLVRGGSRHYWPYTVESAYELTGPSATVLKDPRSTIVSTPIVPPVPADIHAMAHSWIQNGFPFQALVAGPPGGFAVFTFGDWLPAGAPTLYGPLQIDPLTLQLGPLVALSPTDGRYTWSLACPTSIPIAHAFAFQAAVLSPTGVVSLTVPSPFAVAWPWGTLPP